MAIFTGRFGLTVTFTWLEYAGLPVAQEWLEVSRQVTISPLVGVRIYVGLFDPTYILFTIHWKIGLAPPLIPLAVNVTGLPWHDGLEEAPILTLTAREVLTVIVIELDVAGLPVVQVAFDVSLQLTTSPLAGI